MKSYERQCSSCRGVCGWHDEAWVCRKCGSEWYPEHGEYWAAPGDPGGRVHVIHSETLMGLLRRAHAGEDPDLLYIEEYVNAQRETIEGSDA